MDGKVSRQAKLIVELLARVDEMLLRTDGLLSPDYPSIVEKSIDTPVSATDAAHIHRS